MEEAKKKQTKGKKIAIAIAVVAILLLISIILLLLVDCRDGFFSSAPGNIINGTEGEKIVLNGTVPDGSRFSLDNMFPGDSEAKQYRVQLCDDGVRAISFRADITKTAPALAASLQLTVEAGDEQLYSGPIQDAPASLRATVAEDTEELPFTITVSLATSAGNECAGQELLVDFDWWVDSEDYVSTPGGGNNHGHGDACCSICPYICLWCWLVGLCGNFCPWCWLIPLLLILLLLLLLLYLLLRKKKEEEPVPPPPPVTPTPKPPKAAPPPAKVNTRRPHGFTKSYNATVTLEMLMAAFAPGETVTLSVLQAKGLVSKKAKGYKVLIGESNEIDRPLHITATSFSAPAKAAIQAAGGTAKRDIAYKKGGEG